MGLGFDLPANVQGIGFVDHVFQRQHDAAVKLVGAGRIKLIGHGYETDIPGHKVLLDIIAGIYEIAAQAGQVFDDHAVNMPCFDFFQHILKTGPVIVQAGQAVIGKGADNLKFGLVRQIILDDQLLILQGIAAIVVILHR